MQAGNHDVRHQEGKKVKAGNDKKYKRSIPAFWVAVLCLVAAGALAGVIHHMVHDLPEQDMAGRWNKEGGAAQISCFFSANSGVDEDRLEEFEHALDSYLTENSIETESANPGARLWADAYSGDGKITLTSGKTSMEADATGIGGDFFLFHPQKLLYGSYFSGNDLNQDYCVIDEDAAWQLFGSNNVAGMMVTIGGIPHIVQGVIKRSDGRMVEAAGLDGTRVYVSYQTLKRYGTVSGINHYEIVMPNPVRQFALKYVKEQLGGDERETETVENSTRFSLVNCLKRMRDFGTRSMNGRAIIYPYWENFARGYEDIVGALLLMTAVLLIYPAVYGVRAFVYFWRHKGWTFKDLWIKIKDRVDRLWEKRYYSKHKKEES